MKIRRMNLKFFRSEFLKWFGNEVITNLDRINDEFENGQLDLIYDLTHDYYYDNFGYKEENYAEMYSWETPNGAGRLQFWSTRLEIALLHQRYYPNGRAIKGYIPLYNIVFDSAHLVRMCGFEQVFQVEPFEEVVCWGY